ncbi:hypothetical protein C8R45DRAFT_921091 [Mycena sanguinolenta]|nr:hypothetical protein C8R45DRAFT_921091 [Mycena sanguinolenta]
MAREDNGNLSNDEEAELEEPTASRNPVASRTPTASSSKQSSSATPASEHTPPRALTAVQKKNEKKRKRQRAKRREETVAAIKSSVPPVPPPHILDRAAACTPIAIDFASEEFRATQQRWTGPSKPLDHSLLAHAANAEFLKKHLDYFDWPGQQSHTLVDRKGRVIGVLIAPPADEEWDGVTDRATEAFRHARETMVFPATAFCHRRASGEGFPTSNRGFAFGGGRQDISNYKSSSQTNKRAMDELMQNPAVNRAATYPFPLCFPMFSDYHQTKRKLLKRNPHLHQTFPCSPFAAATANLGPFSVSPPHLDGANKADGMCLISAFSKFNADKGTHLVLWDFNLMIRFPAGRSALIPSAVVTHSNTPIAADEERFSLIQYSARSLFRWVNNGFQSDLAWRAAATAADLVQREEERKARCRTALKKFSLWKDVKVKNFSGRARVEVWDQGDVADFSDLTEESDDEEPARKKSRL